MSTNASECQEFCKFPWARISWKSNSAGNQPQFASSLDFNTDQAKLFENATVIEICKSNWIWYSVSSSNQGILKCSQILQSYNTMQDF